MRRYTCPFIILRFAFTIGSHICQPFFSYMVERNAIGFQFPKILGLSDSSVSRAPGPYPQVVRPHQARRRGWPGAHLPDVPPCLQPLMGWFRGHLSESPPEVADLTGLTLQVTSLGPRSPRPRSPAGLFMEHGILPVGRRVHMGLVNDGNSAVTSECSRWYGATYTYTVPCWSEETPVKNRTRTPDSQYVLSYSSLIQIQIPGVFLSSVLSPSDLASPGSEWVNDGNWRSLVQVTPTNAFCKSDHPWDWNTQTLHGTGIFTIHWGGFKGIDVCKYASPMECLQWYQ